MGNYCLLYTSNLDIRHKGRALQVAKDLSREGKCVVSVLHDMDLAAVFADAVIIMKAGRVFAAGPTRAVLTEENLSLIHILRMSRR